MKRTVLFTALLGILLAAGFAFSMKVQAAPEIPEDIRYYDAVFGEATWHQETWTPGDETTILIVNMPETGLFDINNGYVFTAPLKINGEIVPTFFVEGELAPKFVYSKTVEAGEQLVFEITPNPPGSELGFWYTLLEQPETECQTAELTVDGTTPLVFDWDQELDNRCVLTTVETTGTLEISGWVFTPTLYLNDILVETEMIEGQLAPQIVPFSMTVNAGEVLTWTVDGWSGGAQLGIFYTLTPPPPPEVPSYVINLPIVFGPIPTPPPTLVYTETMTTMPGELQVKSHGWPQAESEQPVCLRIIFEGTGQSATIESGWSFGQIVTGFVDGMEFPIPFTPGSDGNAGTIGEINLGPVSLLEVCSVNKDPANEIGLRIRFPGQ